MTIIYILRLDGGKYYIGRSDDVMKRYQQHIEGTGSAWTRLHKPIAVIKTIETISSFEEDKITKEYMSIYGIDNVRGGAYVEVELSASQRAAVQIEIWAAKNLCTRCGRPGHYVKDCYAKSDVSGNVIDNEDDDDSEDEDEESDDDDWECNYCDRTFTTKYEATVHERSCILKHTIIHTNVSNICYRCGRKGHYSPDCYASTHSKGYYL